MPNLVRVMRRVISDSDHYFLAQCRSLRCGKGGYSMAFDYSRQCQRVVVGDYRNLRTRLQEAVQADKEGRRFCVPASAPNF